MKITFSNCLNIRFLSIEWAMPQSKASQLNLLFNITILSKHFNHQITHTLHLLEMVFESCPSHGSVEGCWFSGGVEGCWFSGGCPFSGGVEGCLTGREVGSSEQQAAYFFFYRNFTVTGYQEAISSCPCKCVGMK